MCKFEILEPKNVKNLHFCTEKVTKIENDIVFKVHFFMNLVPLWYAVNLSSGCSGSIQSVFIFKGGFIFKDSMLSYR